MADHVRPMSSFVGRRVRVTLDDPNGTHRMTGVVLDVDDTRLLLRSARRAKPIPVRFISSITDLTKES